MEGTSPDGHQSPLTPMERYMRWNAEKVHIHDIFSASPVPGYNGPGTTLKEYRDRELIREWLKPIVLDLLNNQHWTAAHFGLLEMIRLEYRDREIDRHLKGAIIACQHMISIQDVVAEEMQEEERLRHESMRSHSGILPPKSIAPTHPGFRQLSIILEKQGDFEDALEVCEQAAASWWSGDWDKRIARLRKKVEKLDERK